MWKQFLLIIGLAVPLAAQTVSVTVQNSINTSVGLHGRHNLFMSTSFQPAEWDYTLFDALPGATAPLNQLLPRHLRVQAISEAIPQTTATAWNFAELNDLLSKIQGVGDHSPEFQYAAIPPYLGSTQGTLTTTPSAIPPFVDYATKMLQYYNTGGFDVNGTHYQAPVPYPITWWGILNEPDVNGVNYETYPTVYNALVPKLKAADPGMKAVALELCCFADHTWGTPWVPYFLQNVTAPVDAVALHHYATCNQRDLDTTLYGNTAEFITNALQYTIAQLASTKGMENVPVWITENNVNADYSNNGISACNPPETYVQDPRANNAFFAAWRPYMYSQAVKSGAQALHHWDFAADAEFGEINASTGSPLYSWWVDYYLSRFFPVPPGLVILSATSSDANVEVLAARNADGSVVVMAANHAIAKSTDNNGPGVAKTVNLNLSALGSFTYGTKVVIDSTTSAATGPTEVAFSPGASLSVNLNGYSVVFVRLAHEHAALASVTNAASGALAGTAGAIAPGEIVAIRGAALGPPEYAPMTHEHPKLVGTNIAGTRVLFGGQPAALLVASAGEVLAVVPYSVAGSTSTLVQVDYLGDLSTPVSVPVVATAPALFTVDGSGAGQAVAENPTGAMNSSSNPAHAGDTVRLYATGEGVTNSPYDAVVAGATPPQPLATVSATVGGQSATVAHASGVAGLPPGVLEVDVVVPSGLPAGAAQVLLSVGGTASAKGVTIAVE